MDHPEICGKHKFNKARTQTKDVIDQQTQLRNICDLTDSTIPNKVRKTTQRSYLSVVTENGGCHRKVRSDCGTENGLLAAAQRYFMADIESHIYGSSPHNQRREAWWSFYQWSKATWWINFLKDLMEQSAFTPGHDLQMECLWFCFSSPIKRDLNIVKDHWYTHLIRKS